MRWAIAVACVGCWRGSTAPPPPEAPPPSPRSSPPDAAPFEQPIDVMAALPPDPKTACPSGVGLAARIIGIAVANATTIVTVGGGTNAGVDPSWTTIGRTPQRPCAIVRVDTAVTKLQCPITPDQIRASPAYLLLCAP